MMLNPRPGQRVRVRYGAWRHRCQHMPLHDRIGIVRIVCRSRPRNHGVEIDARIYAIPCGNLMKVKPERQHGFTAQCAEE